MSACTSRIALACIVNSLVVARAATASAECDPCLGTVLPMNGGTAPTNTHFWVETTRTFSVTDDPGRFADAYIAFSPAPADPEGGSQAVSAPIVGVLTDVSGCSLERGIVELAPPSALAPSFTYSAEAWASESTGFGAFTTSDGADDVAPTFAGVGDVVVERIRCDFRDRVEERLRVTASGDGAARDDGSVSSFRLYAGEEVIAGSIDSTMSAILPALDEERCFSMRAVDLAGNVDDNGRLSCLGPDDVVVGPSYALDGSGYQRWRKVTAEEETADVPTRSGCRAAPGRSRGSTWLGWLAVALAFVLRSRRGL